MESANSFDGMASRDTAEVSLMFYEVSLSVSPAAQ